MSETMSSTTTSLYNDKIEAFEDVESVVANEEEEIEDNGDYDDREGEDEDNEEYDEVVENAPIINKSNEVLMKYGCLICKKSTAFTYKSPPQHNAATGVYVCQWCSDVLEARKRLRLEEEKRKAAGEVGERVYYTRNDEVRKERKLTEHRDLWAFLSSDVSSWPLASQGVLGYALCRLQTMKDNPLVIELEDNVNANYCHDDCPCPYNETKRGRVWRVTRRFIGDDANYSDYPSCAICVYEVCTASSYYKHLNASSNCGYLYCSYYKHLNAKPNCGYLYCVICRQFVCEKHSGGHHHNHSGTWIVTYEDAFEYKSGRIPQYDECWNDFTPYVFIDMSTLRQTCHGCTDKSPDNDYIYFRKANGMIRDRLAAALATPLCNKALVSGIDRALNAKSDTSPTSSSPPSTISNPTPSSSAQGEKGGPGHDSTIEQPSLSIPALINLFKQVEIPLFDLLRALSDIDDTIRGMLPVDKTEKVEDVESTTLGKCITVRTWQYKTPLDEHVDTCRRLWGEVSNDLINRVGVYAKSRYGMARSIEHCLDALKVSSLLMSSDSTERNQEEKGGSEKTCQQGEMRSEVTGKDSSQVPESASAVAKSVTKDDILSTLNQVPITRESVSEEVTYLRTLECLRETIEHGDPLFLTLTRKKVKAVATSLKHTLKRLKAEVVALKEQGTLDIAFVDNVKTVITKHSTLLKKAGKIEYWMSI